MLEKRIVVCLDVRDGKTTKGIKFQGNLDIGDPVAMAKEYYLSGVDELVFYDITASSEDRGIMLRVVEQVAEQIFIPFTVGGGISCLDDMKRVILAGAEKISVNTHGVKNPGIIEQGASLFGSQAIVLGMDVLKDSSFPSGYRVVTHGGRVLTDLDAVQWALQAQSLGAGEIVLNSIDTDGVRQGYELTITRRISEAVNVPVVASGGAGTPEHLAQVLTTGKADAALIASMVHFGDYTLPQIKQYLFEQSIPVRMDWGQKSLGC